MQKSLFRALSCLPGAKRLWVCSSHQWGRSRRDFGILHQNEPPGILCPSLWGSGWRSSWKCLSPMKLPLPGGTSHPGWTRSCTLSCWLQEWCKISRSVKVSVPGHTNTALSMHSYSSELELTSAFFTPKKILVVQLPGWLWVSEISKQILEITMKEGV